MCSWFCRLCWTLAVVTVVSPALIYAQPPQDEGRSNARRSAVSRRIPSETVLGVIAYPRRVLTAPEAKLLPIEVISAAGKQRLGFDPLKVEMAVAVVGVPAGGPPPFAIALRLTESFDWQQLPAQLLEQTKDGQLRGQSYRQAQKPAGVSIFMPDERWLIVGTDSLLRTMAADSPSAAEGTVAKLLEQGDGHDLHAVLAMDKIRDLLNIQLQQLPPLPPGLDELKEAPDLIASVEVRMDMLGGGGALWIHGTDTAAADRLQQLTESAIRTGKQIALAQIRQETTDRDPVSQAGGQYMERMIGMLFDTFNPQREADSLVVRAEGTQQSQLAASGVGVALLLPAVQAAREAARRTASVNKMRQLGLGILNFESAKGRFPAAANYSDDGKPLLSWRVHILPYLEEQALYEKFRLDEPWDSPHNRTLIDHMPTVFACPNLVVQNKTPYLAVVGSHAMFDGKQGRTIRDITDGTSKTIMLVEADDPVIWTKPQDLDYDPDKPLAGLGHMRPGGFNACFADCAVQFIQNNIDPDVLRAQFTIDRRDRADTVRP